MSYDKCSNNDCLSKKTYNLRDCRCTTCMCLACNIRINLIELETAKRIATCTNNNMSFGRPHENKSLIPSVATSGNDGTFVKNISLESFPVFRLL
jgi:hypothetical protein